jgi:hypothetical protein
MLEYIQLASKHSEPAWHVLHWCGFYVGDVGWQGWKVIMMKREKSKKKNIIDLHTDKHIIYY